MPAPSTPICATTDATAATAQITHVHLRNKMDQPPRAAVPIARGSSMNGAMGQRWAGGKEHTVAQARARTWGQPGFAGISAAAAAADAAAGRIARRSRTAICTIKWISPLGSHAHNTSVQQERHSATRVGRRLKSAWWRGADLELA